MRRITATLLLLFATLSSPAQAWPERPIQIIFPYPPGGASDTVARAMAQRFNERMGVPVAVLNRDGGSGSIGARVLATARPDGYTIGFIPAGVLTIQPQLNPDVGYTLANFRAICQVFSGGFILATRRSNGLASGAAFLDAARRDPGGVAVGIGGNYTIPHWALLRLQRSARVEFNIVAFRGDTGVVQGLLSGDLPAGLMASGSAISAQLPIIMSMTDERQPELPDVPTARELGFDAAEEQFGGLFAPAGLPDAIATRLEAECAAAMTDTRVSGPLRNAGLRVTHRGAAEFSAVMQADLMAKRELIAATGVQRQ